MEKHLKRSILDEQSRFRKRITNGEASTRCYDVFRSTIRDGIRTHQPALRQICGICNFENPPRFWPTVAGAGCLFRAEESDSGTNEAWGSSAGQQIILVSTMHRQHVRYQTQSHFIYRDRAQGIGYVAPQHPLSTSRRANERNESGRAKRWLLAIA